MNQKNLKGGGDGRVACQSPAPSPTTEQPSDFDCGDPEAQRREHAHEDGRPALGARAPSSCAHVGGCDDQPRKAGSHEGETVTAIPLLPSPKHFAEYEEPWHAATEDAKFKKVRRAIGLREFNQTEDAKALAEFNASLTATEGST